MCCTMSPSIEIEWKCISMKSWKYRLKKMDFCLYSSLFHWALITHGRFHSNLQIMKIIWGYTHCPHGGSVVQRVNSHIDCQAILTMLSLHAVIKSDLCHTQLDMVWSQCLSDCEHWHSSVWVSEMRWGYQQDGGSMYRLHVNYYSIYETKWALSHWPGGLQVPKLSWL